MICQLTKRWNVVSSFRQLLGSRGSWSGNTSINAPLACTLASPSSRSNSRSIWHSHLSKLNQLTSFGTSERLRTCAARAEDPLVPASRQLIRSSRAPPLDRTSHRVHHRSAAVQLQRLLSRLLTYCKELELCLLWTSDRNCIRWSSDQERDNSAPSVNVTTSKPWPPRR
jgi:hypothetical protein